MKIEGTRSVLAEMLLYHQNKPFSFEGREYLIPLYDTNRNVVLKAGRQTEKSTSLANIMVLDAISYPFFNCLYVSYTSKQVSFFSSLRVQPILVASPFIRKYFYTGTDLIKRVYDKTLRNHSGLFFRSMYHSAETIRGLNVDRICFDETQNLDPDDMLVVEETLSHSKYKFRIYAGTAKTSANELERLWRRSTQVEYVIKCEHCGHWNYQDEKIIGKDGYICSKCGKSINMRNGKLVMFGDPNSDYFGLRVTQLMVPWMTFKEILDKYERMPIWLFYNEVLALPYEYAEMPITLDELLQCCSDREFTEVIPSYTMPTYCAGIDWGSGQRSFTVITIGHWEGSRYYIDYVNRLKVSEPLAQIDALTKLCYSYHVKFVVCDYGFGFGLTDMLRNALRDQATVVSCLYTVEKTPVRWVEKEAQFHVNRSWIISNLFMKLKNKQVNFPKSRLMMPFFEDILNVRAEMRRSGQEETLVYVHDAEHPDDFLHSLCYCVLALDTIRTWFSA
ncbi:MAG: phage terminase large subunit family protein [Candidatus Aenigmatarchaeota archaeon]